MNEHVEKELKAFQAMTELLSRAKEVARLFQDADMPIPPTLSRILGDSVVKNDNAPKLVVSQPKTPPRPKEAEEGWIWIDAADATPTTMLLAILRQRQAATTSKEAYAELSKYLPDANYGSILNIGARLDGNVIERTDEGWSLKNPTAGPILHDRYIWGPASAFHKQELAAHRRALICHILQAVYGGLQTVQLVHQLKNSGLCLAPVSKDLVKADLEVLETEEKARRVGNSRKWTLVRTRKTSD
jgi:hypothetical protein